MLPRVVASATDTISYKSWAQVRPEGSDLLDGVEPQAGDEAFTPKEARFRARFLVTLPFGPGGPQLFADWVDAHLERQTRPKQLALWERIFSYFDWESPEHKVSSESADEDIALVLMFSRPTCCLHL